MQEIGEILHLASSGRVIIRLDKKVEEGQILCDRKNTKIAKVMELIGPVDQPYASASSLTNNIKKFTGKKMFALDHIIPAVKPKKFRRKKR